MSDIKGRYGPAGAIGGRVTLSVAERQRRSRKHRAGDHSLCDPDRCPDATGEPVTDGVTSQVTRDVTPDGLGRRGKRLWRDLTAAAQLGPADLVMLEEACRIADRLDRLDAYLQGREDAWLRFHRNDDGTVVRVVIDRALAEARQQADTLRMMVSDLTRKPAALAPDKPEGGSRRDELARRREERRKAAGL